MDLEFFQQVRVFVEALVTKAGVAFRWDVYKDPNGPDVLISRYDRAVPYRVIHWPGELSAEEKGAIEQYLLTDLIEGHKRLRSRV
jgi:hypothetical protein